LILGELIIYLSKTHSLMKEQIDHLLLI